MRHWSRALGKRGPYCRSKLPAWPLVLLLPWLARSPAVAAEPSPPPRPERAGAVAMWPPLCGNGTFWLTPFLDSLRVELAGRGLACCKIMEAGRTTSPKSVLTVKLELVPCAADADRVRVSVSEPARAAMAEREVSLADVAEAARPRALALAAAEMLRSLGQSAPVVNPKAPPVADNALTAPPSPASDARNPSTLSLHFEGEARGVPTRDTLVWGGRAGLDASWRLLHVRLDVGGGFANARVDDSGNVLLRTVSAGLCIGPRFTARPMIFDVGLRAELGWVWVRGESNAAFVRKGAGSDLTAVVGLRSSVEAPSTFGVRPRVSLEGGPVLRGVKAEAHGVTVAGITGYYLLGAVGVAIAR